MAGTVAALALSGGQAGAAGLSNENLTPTGSLTYTWHGDPVRGCAAVGVCDVRGELVLRPLGGGQLFTFSRVGPADINFGVSGVVRVLRGEASPSECVDVADADQGGIDIRLPSRRSATAVLDTPAASGRCAGPLQSDIGRLSLPLKRSGSRGGSFDLSGRRSFVAGPFSGTLVSSLVLKRGPSPHFSQASSSSGSSPGPSGQVLEYARLVYRMSAASNVIQTLFKGSADGACQVLDSCGAGGSLDLLVAPAATFTVFANRIVHRRLSAGQVLGDLRHDRLMLSGFSTLQGYVNESYDWGDGSSCHDSVPTPSLQLILGSPGPGPSRGHLPVTIASNSGPGTEVMRTHCPGPSDSDLIGQNDVLASGSVTPEALLAKRLTLELADPNEFTGLGYTGSRSDSIRLDLALTRVHAGTSPAR